MWAVQVELDLKDVVVVFCGGTIGSEIGESNIDVSQDSESLVWLVNSFCQERGLDPTIINPFSFLSEDMSPDTWVTLIQTIKKLLDDGHKSIVITHGTDTMAYSSTALSIFFGNTDARIVMTGSFYSEDHPRSDVQQNLTSALVAATSVNLEPGVYAAFGDSTGSVPVMPAIDLKPMEFDSRQFQSRYDFYIGCVLPNIGFRHYDLNSYVPEQNSLTLDHPENWSTYSDDSTNPVIQLMAYPGIKVDRLVGSLPASSIILMNLYHSGTAYSIDDPGSLVETIKKRDDLDFIITPLPVRYVDPIYVSTTRLVEAGATLYRDLMPHSLYVWFVLGQMAGYSKQELLDKLQAWQIKS